MNHENRLGRITSSWIAALMSNGKKEGTFGAPFYTAVDECVMEAKLGLPLDAEVNSRPLSWGNCCEKHVLEAPNILSTEYRPQSKGTLMHPTIQRWAGTPDALKFKGSEPFAVCDVKCPYTRKSFATFSECKTIEEVRTNHKDGEKYYWQLVSNAILTGVDVAELIVFAPYFSELQAIRDIADSWPDESETFRFKWIAFASYKELPYINEDGHYKHLHTIQFEVPQADKDALTARVLAAAELIEARFTQTEISY